VGPILRLTADAFRLNAQRCFTPCLQALSTVDGGKSVGVAFFLSRIITSRRSDICMLPMQTMQRRGRVGGRFHL
jgi:hypothetical protein